MTDDTKQKIFIYAVAILCLIGVLVRAQNVYENIKVISQEVLDIPQESVKQSTRGIVKELNTVLKVKDPLDRPFFGVKFKKIGNKYYIIKDSPYGAELVVGEYDNSYNFLETDRLSLGEDCFYSHAHLLDDGKIACTLDDTYGSKYYRKAREHESVNIALWDIKHKNRKLLQTPPTLRWVEAELIALKGGDFLIIGANDIFLYTPSGFKNLLENYNPELETLRKYYSKRVLPDGKVLLRSFKGKKLVYEPKTKSFIPNTEIISVRADKPHSPKEEFYTARKNSAYIVIETHFAQGDVVYTTREDKINISINNLDNEQIYKFDNYFVILNTNIRQDPYMYVFDTKSKRTTKLNLKNISSGKIDNLGALRVSDDTIFVYNTYGEDNIGEFVKFREF